MSGRFSTRSRALARAKAPLLGLFVVLLALVCVSLSVSTPRAEALTASSYLNFQARLYTASGGVVSDGNYNLEFKIYNADSTTGSQGSCSGSCLWMATLTGGNTVPVVDGYFSVSLGAVNTVGSFGSINWDQQLYLTMRIGGTGTPSWDPEMQNSGHSIPITSAPLAFRANQLAVAGTNEQILQFASSTFGQTTTISLPDPGASTATVCYQNASACGFAPGTNASYIQNSTGGPQSANFNIISAATGSIGAIVSGHSSQSVDIFDVDSSGSTVYLGVNSNGTNINLGGTNPTIGATATNSNLTLQANGTGSLLLDTGASGGNVTIGNTAGTLAIGNSTSAHTINIGAGATNTQTVNIGSINGSSAVQILGGGTGSAISLQGGTGGTISIGSSNANTINIGNTSGNAVSISSGSANISLISNSSSASIIAQSLTNSVTAFQVQNLSGVNILNVDTSNSLVGTAATSSGSTNSQDLNLRTGNASGSTSNSGTLRIDVGTATGTTGSILIGTVNNPTAITIGSTSQTGTITLGQSTATNAISIGTAAGNGNTQTISIGNSSTSGSTTNVTIGSTAGGQTTIQGTANSANQNVLTVSGASNTTGSSTQNGASFTLTANPSSASTSQFNGVYGTTISSTNKTSTAKTYAGFFQGTSINGGNVGTVVGVEVQNVAANLGGGAATIGSDYGLQVGNPTKVGSTITSNAGANIDNQTSGTNNTNLLIGTETIPSGNYSIYNSSSNANYFGGATTIQTSGSNSAAALQVQNSSGDILANLDSTNANLITNGSFESNTTGWSSSGAVITRVTTDHVFGTAALQIAMTNSGDEAKYPITLTNSVAYDLTFFVENTSGASGNNVVGYSYNGVNETTFNCNGAYITTGSWQQYNCLFTPTSISGSPYIFFKQNAAAARTNLIDGVYLVASSHHQSYQMSTLQLNGVINSPVNLQNATDTTQALIVSNAAGNDQALIVDTVNNEVGVGVLLNNNSGIEAMQSGYSLDVGLGGIFTNGEINIKASNSNALQIISAGAGNPTFLNVDTSAGTSAVISIGSTGSQNNNSTIHIADSSAAVQTITIGSTSSSSAVTIQAGTGDITLTGHIQSTAGTAPTIGTPTNCGTSPTAAVTSGSTDSAGSFTITAGTVSPTSCTTVITFNTTYTSTPKMVQITSTSTVGSATNERVAYISAISATSFTISINTNLTGNTPAASEVMSFYYWVIK